MAAATTTTKKLSWKFPLNRYFLFRLEIFFILVLALLIFLWLMQLGTFAAVILTLIFLLLYVIVSYFVQRIRHVEENYQLTPTHLHITKKVRNKVEKEKVHLKEVKHHKLDRFFLGGYMLTHQGKKHPLFFNTKKELKNFEDFLKKNLGITKNSLKTKVSVKRKKVKGKKK